MFTTNFKFTLLTVLFVFSPVVYPQDSSEPLYEVLDPRGRLPDIELMPLSPRLNDMHDKTIYVIHSWPQGGGFEYVLDYFSDEMEARFPDSTVVHKNRNVTYSQDDPELWEEVIQNGDGFVYVGAPSSSTTHYAVKWTSKLETMGVPGVVLMFDTLSSVRETTIEREGVNTRFVDVMYPSDDMSDDQLEQFFNNMTSSLTAPLTDAEVETGLVPTPSGSRLLMTGTLSDVQDYFYDNGLTDGLPIIPPTEEAVARMLQGTSHEPDKVVVESMVPDGLRVTVEEVAINAVMAGSKPEHMPVLLATLEALVNYEMLTSLNAIVRSTNSFGFMQVVNGPIRNELSMKSGTDLLGPGNLANSSIGRSLRLFITNLGGGVPGVNMMAVIGSMATHPFVFAENEEESPWESLNVTQGYDEGTNTLTLFMGGLSHAGNYGHVDFGLQHVAADIAQFELARGATIIVSPKRAELLAEAGMSKQDVIDYLSENATLTLGELRSSRYFNEPADAASLRDSDEIPVYDAESIYLVVAGGDASPMMQAWEMYRPVTVTIDKWK